MPGRWPRGLTGLLMAASLASGLSLDAVDREFARRRYVRDPVAWVTEQLGEFVWSKQRAMCESVRDHRRTAVRSCHEAGKSFIAARIAAWWLATHPVGEAFVVTSAPSFPQVRAILWREIGRAHGKGKLPGRVNQTEWFMTTLDGREELVGFGRKPADMDPTGFQGIHARYVLVIFDEACGIPRQLWDAADSLVANDDSRFFAIGNPDDPITEFAEVCKPGSGWNVIGISAFETPNLTNEPVPDDLRPLLVGKLWVEEKKRKWGEDSPIYKSKVLGEFPETSDDGLIPISWIAQAQQRELEPGLPSELGVDVGGGRDKSVVAHRRGPVVRIVKKTNTPDTMETTGHIIQVLKATKATVAKVDHIGIGRGVVDRGRELKCPFVPVNVAAKPTSTLASERFVNLRAQFYWGLRERFQAGDIDIDTQDDDLAAQLCALRFFTTSRGQIQIESKDDLRKRGLPSPDDADAVMLAFAAAWVVLADDMEAGDNDERIPDRF